MMVKEKLRPDETSVARIRALNDSFRSSFHGGRVVLTASVAALDAQAKASVLEAVRTFTDFNADNDPHAEHDMCFVEVNGDRYWSKKTPAVSCSEVSRYAANAKGKPVPWIALLAPARARSRRKSGSASGPGSTPDQGSGTVRGR